MRKILFLLTTLLLLEQLCASEAEVKKAISEYMQSVMTMDISRANTICHPDYILVTAGGRELNMDHANRIGKLTEFIRKNNSGNENLLDIVEAAAIITRRKLTEETRQQAIALQGTWQGKLWLLSQKPLILLATYRINAVKNKYCEAAKSFKITSCSVKGNTASLIYEMKSLDSDTMELYETEWEKVNGKWLIKKTVVSKIEKNSDPPNEDK